MKKNVINTTIVIAFLIGLFDTELSGEVTRDIAETLFHDIISDLAES